MVATWFFHSMYPKRMTKWKEAGSCVNPLYSWPWPFWKYSELYCRWLVHNFQILAVFVLQNKEPIFLLKWIRRRKWSGLLIILEVPTVVCYFFYLCQNLLFTKLQIWKSTTRGATYEYDRKSRFRDTVWTLRLLCKL